MYAEVTLILIFSIGQKCKRAPLVLNICVKTIQWHNLWYHFLVVIQSYFGERAVSFKKVSLPESLYVPVTVCETLRL